MSKPTRELLEIIGSEAEGLDCRDEAFIKREIVIHEREVKLK